MRGLEIRFDKKKLNKILSGLILLLNIGFIFAITGFAIEQTYPSNVTIRAFQVIRDTYDGSTSNFTGLSESMLRDMPSVVLENTSHGRIGFNENLDLVTMAEGDLIVNFDMDLNISDNLINLQNSNLPGIDKSVNISLWASDKPFKNC